jgi:sarcosine oxidase subunit beta
LGRTVDAVVVGGGIMGAGIAVELSRWRLQVLVCEQDRAPGRGATSWYGGLLRQHHTAHCDTRLAVRSLPTFQRWPAVIGGDCGYRRTGFLVLVAAHNRERLEHNVAAVNQAGGTSEVVEVPELAARYPALAFDDAGLVGAFEPDGGHVDARATTLSLVAAAIEAGADYGEGVVVTGVSASSDVVTGVETNVGSISAPVVVLAAGAWSARLAAPLGVELPLEARRIGLARGVLDVPADRLPCAIDDTLGTYFRPDGTDRGLYFGVALDPAVDLDEHPPPVDAGELDAAHKTVAIRVPEARSATISGTRAGFDGYTPDHHPVIGVTDPDGLYLCTGFSGGGVKVMPAVAHAVAAEIVGGSSSDLLEPYRPQRFAMGLPIASDCSYDYI